MNRAVNVVVDDLLSQPVQALVCEWYYGRPAWWPFPASVGARDLRTEAGAEVFRELSEDEPLDAGEAILTGTGRLRQYKGFVCVASRSIWGGSSEAVIQNSARSAMEVVHRLRFTSVAFPVLGAGRSLTERKAYEILRDTLIAFPTDVEVRIIRSPDRPR